MSREPDWEALRAERIRADHAADWGSVDDAMGNATPCWICGCMVVVSFRETHRYRCRP